MISNVRDLVELIRETAPGYTVRRYSSDTATVRIGDRTLTVQLAPTLMRLHLRWVQFDINNVCGYRSAGGSWFFGPLAPDKGWVHQIRFQTVDELSKVIHEAVEALASGRAGFFEGCGHK